MWIYSKHETISFRRRISPKSAADFYIRKQCNVPSVSLSLNANSVLLNGKRYSMVPEKYLIPQEPSLDIWMQDTKNRSTL